MTKLEDANGLSEEDFSVTATFVAIGDVRSERIRKLISLFFFLLFFSCFFFCFWTLGIADAPSRPYFHVAHSVVISPEQKKAVFTYFDKIDYERFGSTFINCFKVCVTLRLITMFHFFLCRIHPGLHSHVLNFLKTFLSQMQPMFMLKG